MPTTATIVLKPFEDGQQKIGVDYSFFPDNDAKQESKLVAGKSYRVLITSLVRCRHKLEELLKDKQFLRPPQKFHMSSWVVASASETDVEASDRFVAAAKRIAARFPNSKTAQSYVDVSSSCIHGTFCSFVGLLATEMTFVFILMVANVTDC